MALPRLLFLHTGGTLGMVRSGDPGVLKPAAPAPDLVPHVPALGRVADIDGEVIANVDSSDISPNLWAKLAESVAEHHDAYDGFVVLHGTDTMSFTAAALSFMLSGAHKPVVFTGSQRPLSEARTDARTNLVHSAIAASMDIPEVSLYFGSHLFRGNRCTKTSIHAYEAFASPNYPPLLEMGVDIQRIAPTLSRTGPLTLRTACSTEVSVLSLFPGMSPTALTSLVEAGRRVVVIRSFGEGNLPQRDWPEAIRAATASGAHVIVNSQCRVGSSSSGRYLGSALAKDAGAIFAGDMTGETAVVKAMWLLGQGVDGEDFTTRFRTPLAGELTPG
jgi:L-asparaginase